jgi:hypothetical protein
VTYANAREPRRSCPARSASSALRSASWLRSAARGFESGVLSDDGVRLGEGFRSLQAYFILGGLVGLASLLLQLYQWSGAL